MAIINTGTIEREITGINESILFTDESSSTVNSAAPTERELITSNDANFVHPIGEELNDYTWDHNGGWSLLDGVSSNDGSGSTLSNDILEIGKEYIFKVKLSSYTSGNFRLFIGGSTISSTFSNTNDFTFKGVCSGDTSARIQSLVGVGSIRISEISIKELLVNRASNVTNTGVIERSIEGVNESDEMFPNNTTSNIINL